jgi:hypothetical protein
MHLRLLLSASGCLSSLACRVIIVPLKYVLAECVCCIVSADRKLPGAEKRSEYYRKYGNPVFGGIFTRTLFLHFNVLSVLLENFATESLFKCCMLLLLACGQMRF